MFVSKIVIVQQEVFAKVNKSIKEVKRFNFNVEFANKCYLISTSINARPSSFMIMIIRILSIHPISIVHARHKHTKHPKICCHKYNNYPFSFLVHMEITY
jgi:hypothetical protein